MTNDHYRAAVETGDTADNRFVVGIGAIASQLVKVVKSVANVVKRIRTQRMARQLRDLPCAQIGEDFTGQLNAFLAQALYLFIQINVFIILTTNRRKRINFRFKFRDRLFKIQVIKTHNVPVLVKLQFNLLRPYQRTQFVEQAIAGRNTPRCTKA